MRESSLASRDQLRNSSQYRTLMMKLKCERLIAPKNIVVHTSEGIGYSRGARVLGVCVRLPQMSRPYHTLLNGNDEALNR